MKVGLIGYGYWGKILESKLTKYFNIIFIANSKTDYTQFLEEVEWVFIATPFPTHYNIVKKCLETSKNVFCEKPFTLNPTKSNELFELAERKGVSLYIDNLFLGRNELKNIKIQFNKIKFIWNKNNTEPKDMIGELLYHDLYILFHLLNYSHYEITNIRNEEWGYKFNINNIKVEIKYNLNSNKKEKKIIIDNNIIDLSSPTNDPLDEIIQKISLNLYIDYKLNKEITLQTEKQIYKFL